jgi:hypothetical protein
MSESRLKTSWAFAILDVGVALLSLVWLIPITWALPAIASPAYPFVDTVWLTANLAGSLLLLAVGPRMILSGVPSDWYVGGYTALLIVLGELSLWRSGGFRILGVGWLLMALFDARPASPLLVVGIGRRFVDRSGAGCLVLRRHRRLPVVLIPFPYSLAVPDDRVCGGHRCWALPSPFPSTGSKSTGRSLA